MIETQLEKHLNDIEKNYITGLDNQIFQSYYIRG